MMLIIFATFISLIAADAATPPRLIRCRLRRLLRCRRRHFTTAPLLIFSPLDAFDYADADTCLIDYCCLFMPDADA